MLEPKLKKVTKVNMITIHEAKMPKRVEKESFLRKVILELGVIEKKSIEMTEYILSLNFFRKAISKILFFLNLNLKF